MPKHGKTSLHPGMVIAEEDPMARKGYGFYRLAQEVDSPVVILTRIDESPYDEMGG